VTTAVTFVTRLDGDSGPCTHGACGAVLVEVPVLQQRTGASGLNYESDGAETRENAPNRLRPLLEAPERRHIDPRTSTSAGACETDTFRARTDRQSPAKRKYVEGRRFGEWRRGGIEPRTSGKSSRSRIEKTCAYLRGLSWGHPPCPAIWAPSAQN
jgi:hypothetical protein